MIKLIHTKILKILPKISYFSIIYLGLANSASAQIKNPLKAEDFGDVIKTIAKAIATVGIPAASIFIIYSGFLFVTARGNEQQVTKAKTTFLWTIVGTILIVGAWAIAEALDQFAKGL